MVWPTVVAWFMIKLGVRVALAMLLPGLGCPHNIGVSLVLCPHPTVGAVGRGVTSVAGVITTTHLISQGLAHFSVRNVIYC